MRTSTPQLLQASTTKQSYFYSPRRLLL